MQEHKNVVYSIILTISAIILALIFSTSKLVGINISLIYIIFFIIKAIISGLLWLSLVNNIKTFLIRFQIIVCILINCILIILTLLFIDAFMLSEIIPVFILLLLFGANIFYLKQSFSL